MRIIKFRLWNGSKMEEVGSVSFHTDGSFHVNDEYMVNDKTMEEQFGGNRYYIMQFAGLHDRNDKELYEGDLYQLIGSTSIGVVEWDAGSAGWLIDCKWQKTGSGKIEKRADRFQTPLRRNGLVIGNIYENPDLVL